MGILSPAYASPAITVRRDPRVRLPPDRADDPVLVRRGADRPTWPIQG